MSSDLSAALRRWLFCTFTVFAATACFDTVDFQPSINEFVVQAVLDANVDEQFIILQHTNGVRPSQVSVSGAKVTLITPGGRELPATEVRDSLRFVTSYGPHVSVVYRISLTTFGETWRPGGEYKLRITYPGAQDITGVTRIPDASNVSSSASRVDSLRNNFDTLALVWQRASSAAKYQVTVTATQRSLVAFADTSLAIPGNLPAAVTDSNKSAKFFNAGVYDVTVLAVDENYYRYFKPNADVLTESATAQLHGAIGVFGSVARVSTRKIVVY